VLHTPALRSNLPNTLMVVGEAEQMSDFRNRLAGRGLASKVQ